MMSKLSFSASLGFVRARAADAVMARQRANAGGAITHIPALLSIFRNTTEESPEEFLTFRSGFHAAGQRVG